MNFDPLHTDHQAEVATYLFDLNRHLDYPAQRVTRLHNSHQVLHMMGQEEGAAHHLVLRLLDLAEIDLRKAIAALWN